MIGWKGGPNSEAVKKFEDSVQFSGSNMQHKICSSNDAIGLLIILVSCLQNWQKCTLYFSCSARKNKQSVSSPLHLKKTTETNISFFSKYCLPSKFSKDIYDQTYLKKRKKENHWVTFSKTKSNKILSSTAGYVVTMVMVVRRK